MRILPPDIRLVRMLHRIIASRCVSTKKTRNLLLAMFLVSPYNRGNT